MAYKTNEENLYSQELALDDLEAVSGGRIKAAGYPLLMGLVYELRKRGRTKEEVVDALIESWEQDSTFKTKYTDGTDEDLQKAIDFINKNW